MATDLARQTVPSDGVANRDFRPTS